MLAKIKRIAIYAAIISACIGLSFFGGIMYQKYSTHPIIVGNGSIVERTNYVYTEIAVTNGDPCSDYIRRLNMCNLSFKQFLDATPEVLNVTIDKIYFRLATQKYALPYSQANRPQWALTPIIYVRTDFRTGIGLYYGAGFTLDYAGIGGMLLVDNAVSVTIGAMWRGITW